VSVTPSIGVDGCYDLTPGSQVGTAVFGDLSIEIRPKLAISRLMFLLSYVLDPKHWKDQPFSYAEDQSLLQAVIPGFTFQVRRAFTQGLLQSYRPEEAALPTVRGRIRFDDQIRDRFGIFPPAEVRFDEFTEDIEENRLLKAAIVRLQRLRIRSDAARRSLRALESALGSVQLVDYDRRRLPELIYTRLNQHYRAAVELAKLILRSASFEQRSGKTWATAFLVDMNEVFETFVVTALREALRLSDQTFPQGAKGRRLYLDEGRVVALKPDISWWHSSICSFVGDVKYKRTGAERATNSDLYQLLAYCVATDLPAGLLVYAAGEDEPATHRVVNLGRDLQVVTLELRGQPSEILMQIARLAQRIRTIRERSLTSRVPVSA
jgi:5-methylcytosine-specific restriction enzyme subunit McrC